jgi:DNA-binding Xre family transcriptional regulator
MTPSRTVGYQWHLRQLMAARGIYATSGLIAPLAERGIDLSASQVHRLVTGTPERLSMHVLAALCDILAVEPSDLVTVSATNTTRRRAAGGTTGQMNAAAAALRPTRAQIVPPSDQAHP